MKTSLLIILLCIIATSLLRSSDNGEESKGQLRDAAGDTEVKKLDQDDIEHGGLNPSARFNLTKKQKEKLAFKARNGDGEAAFKLSEYYSHIALDKIECIFWLRMAAGLHHSLAEYNLANTYLNLGAAGFSNSLQDQDVPRAKYWFLRAKHDGEQGVDKRLNEIEAIEQKQAEKEK